MVKNTNGEQLTEVSFSRDSFPEDLTTLPRDLFVRLEATFSVGTETDCRGNDGGMITSQVLEVTYEGRCFTIVSPGSRFLGKFS